MTCQSQNVQGLRACFCRWININRKVVISWGEYNLRDVVTILPHKTVPIEVASPITICFHEEPIPKRIPESFIVLLEGRRSPYFRISGIRSHRNVIIYLYQISTNTTISRSRHTSLKGGNNKKNETLVVKASQQFKTRIAFLPSSRAWRRKF
jgi:hypothetical protein